MTDPERVGVTVDDVCFEVYPSKYAPHDSLNITIHGAPVASAYLRNDHSSRLKQVLLKIACAIDEQQPKPQPTMDEIVATQPMTAPIKDYEVVYLERDDSLETLIEKCDGNEKQARHIKKELEEGGGFAATFRKREKED
jgi:hypothetical protein